MAHLIWILVSLAISATALGTARHHGHAPPPIIAVSHVRVDGNTTERIVYSQVLHRHGSRSPLPPANNSILCPKGCGILNSNGRDMLKQLGLLIKERYGTLYFTSDSYNASEVHTRSTGVARTMQSAGSLLRGVYPNLTAFYPIVITANNLVDQLLQADAMPAFSLYNKFRAADIYSGLAPLIHALWPNPQVIWDMAAELSLSGFCASKGAGWCLVELYDIAACFESDGTLAGYPVAEANFAAMKVFYHQFIHVLFTYNNTELIDQERGSQGQPLAQAMLANMNSYIAGTMPYNFMQYSAHDTTLAPWCVTVGAYGETLPVFGQMYLIDLLEDGGAYYVRGIKGAPLQAPGPHTYTTEPLQLGGIDSSGRTYHINGTTERMPIADFARFVDSTKALNPKGLCYLTTDEISFFDISAINVTPTADCMVYRRNCPQWACPPGSRIDLTSLVCH